MKNLSALFVCGLLLPGAAAAQPAEHIVVTGTRLGDDETNPNDSVLDASRIAARNPASVADLLRDMPGLYVQQSGGRGSVVSVFTRGAQPNFTLVLLDGVKANDPTNSRGGSYDFSTLDLNDIERIELVRGPASAIYGSDALSGVINIISRRGSTTPQAGLSAEGGSFGYVRAAGHASGPIGGATANLGLSYTDSGMPVQGGNLKGTNLDGALDLPELAGTAINVIGRFNNSIATSFPDSSGGPRLAVLRGLDRRDITESTAGAHARRGVADWWQAVLDYGFYQRGADVTSPGVAPSAFTPTGIPANGDKARFTRQQITFTNRLAPFQGLDAAIGMDMQAEHGSDTGYLQFGPARLPTYFALNRTIWAGFGEARYQVAPEFQLSGSLRYDGVDGGHVSPQARVDYRLPDWGTQLQLSWGKAFKLPSFYALGNPIVGDPGLKPEEAENVEAGFTQPLWDTGRWKLTAYATNYRNLIDFQPGPVPKLVNRSTVHVRGMETSADLTWQTLTFTPRLSYNNVRDQATGAALRDVPSWLAGGTILWRPTPDWDVSLNVNHVGRLVSNSVPTDDVTLPAHQQIDLATSYKITPNLAVKLGVDNLFGARYEDVVGFPAPGAVVRGGISASF